MRSDGRRVESRMTGVEGRESRVVPMRVVETRFDESWVVARCPRNSKIWSNVAGRMTKIAGRRVKSLFDGV